MGWYLGKPIKAPGTKMKRRQSFRLCVQDKNDSNLITLSKPVSSQNEDTSWFKHWCELSCSCC